MANSHQTRRKFLQQIARETKALTPTIAAALPHLQVTTSERFALADLPRLDPLKCPRFLLPPPPNDESATPITQCGTSISVIDCDSFDAAIRMHSSVLSGALPVGTSTVETENSILSHLQSSSSSPANLNPTTAPRVVVLNMASEKNPGGGWMNGAAAQEEALCFRSTLAASLGGKGAGGWYPIPARSGLWTRDVVVFRRGVAEECELTVKGGGDGESGSGGSGSGEGMGYEELPVVSVLSVAGIRRPEVKEGEGKRLVFAEAASRELTKDKMRLCLRMAGTQGHTMLVLGALGCGAFKNPPQEVAECWLAILEEVEFSGGWFKHIWFAVLDRKNDGNFPIFKRILDGKIVGVVDYSR